MTSATLSSPENWRMRQHGGKGKAIEAQLAGLRASNRLAIHCFEKEDADTSFPHHVHTAMNANKPYFAGDVTDKLEIPSVNMISMSLLPASGCTPFITPYNVSYGDRTAPSYLIDMEKGNAPKVVRVFDKLGFTGDSFTHKLLYMHEREESPELRSIYDEFRRGVHKARITELSLRDAVTVLVTFASPKKLKARLEEMGHKDAYACHFSGEETESLERKLLQTAFHDPSFSSRQLDALARAYCRHGSQGASDSLNEVIAVVAPQHIAAIAVIAPDNSLRKPKNTFDGSLAALKGALTGIDHARKGMTLPVVSYHLGGKHQGNCTYIAQGEEECRAAALYAVGRLQGSLPKQDAEVVLSRMKEEAQRLLGVDITRPLGIQLPGEGRVP